MRCRVWIDLRKLLHFNVLEAILYVSLYYLEALMYFSVRRKFSTNIE